MTKKTLRIGIIGAGENTRKRHIPNLQAQEGVEIVELANRTRASSEAAAQAFGIPGIRENWQAVATSPDTDAVVIGTWPYLHCPAACLALESGKHVLCEARMAMNAEEAQTMLAVSRKYPDRIAQLVPAPFTFRVDRTVAEAVTSGEFGRLLYFQAEYQAASLAAPDDSLHWRRNIQYSGLNAMVLGIVYESLLRWLPPARWVSAQGRIFRDSARDPDTGDRMKIEIPDYLSVQMELENGMAGSMLISEAGRFGPVPRFRIFGERGTLEFEFTPGGRLWQGTTENGEMQEVAILKEMEDVWRVEEEFVNAILGKETVKLTTFETGVQYMEFTETVIQSFRAGGEKMML